MSFVLVLLNTVMPHPKDTIGDEPHVLVSPSGEAFWYGNRKEALTARHASKQDMKIFHEDDPEVCRLMNIPNCPGDSPIEKIFSYEFKQVFGYFPPSQIEVGPYRVDFLIFDQIVVEIDGHDFHSSKQDRTKDAKRDRYLQSLGFKVFRFTGSEVYADAAACVKELLLSCPYSP